MPPRPRLRARLPLCLCHSVPHASICGDSRGVCAPHAGTLAGTCRGPGFPQIRPGGPHPVIRAGVLGRHQGPLGAQGRWAGGEDATSGRPCSVWVSASWFPTSSPM